MSEPSQPDLNSIVTAPSPQEPEVPKATPESETVRVRVVGPLYTVKFTSGPTEDGPGLVVTDGGTDVPADQVEALILEAAACGVHLAADGEYPSSLTETKAS